MAKFLGGCDGAPPFSNGAPISVRVASPVDRASRCFNLRFHGVEIEARARLHRRELGRVPADADGRELQSRRRESAN